MFLDYANKHVDDIPKAVREFAERTYNGTTTYCSLIGRHYGLYETIFGVRKNRKGTFIQRLAYLRENGEGYIRNVYSTDYGMACGVYSYGYEKQDKYFSYGGKLDYEPQFSPIKEWFDTSRIYRECLNVDEVTTLDPTLKYWNYHPYIEAIKYIRIFRKYPKQAEMLMKFGLYRMITDKSCERLSKEPLFHRWLERHHEECKGLTYKVAHNAWRKNPQGSAHDYYTSLCYRMECAKNLATTDRDIYARLLEHTSRERLCEWISNNHISTRTYYDYIKACLWLKLNLADTKVIYPKNFKEMHDDYTRQYGEYLAEIEERKSAKISSEMADVARKFSFLSYSSDDYTVQIAQRKTDLINEGSALNICVGRMDYDRRQAEGKSVICFIRHKEEPDKPFVCAEVSVKESNLKLVQCYGEGNKLVPEVKPFTDAWMAESNRIYKKAI